MHTSDEEKKAMLLPPEPPPPDLLDRVMSAIMLEPAPTWERDLLQSSSKNSLLANAGGLILSVLCASIIFAVLLLLRPSILISQFDDSLRIAAEYAKAMLSSLALVKSVFTNAIMLVPPTLQAIRDLISTSLTVLRVITFGPLLSVFVLIGAFAVLGQVYLIRLLASRPANQTA